MFYSFDSLANISHDTVRIGIHKKNPFPPLPGFPSNAYAAKWGLTDLYPEDERILRDAIENRKTFDTGWVGCKKEIRYFRIISDGNVVTIQACSEMDDFDDLIYDALDDDIELTDDQLDTLYAYWSEATEMDTSCTDERTMPVTTYEDVMRVLSALEDETQARLDAWFEVIKTWVNDVISLP